MAIAEDYIKNMILKVGNKNLNKKKLNKSSILIANCLLKCYSKGMQQKCCNLC